jgi:hypothetical protein
LHLLVEEWFLHSLVHTLLEHWISRYLLHPSIPILSIENLQIRMEIVAPNQPWLIHFLPDSSFKNESRSLGSYEL